MLESDQCKLFFGYSDRAEVTYEDFLAALHPKDRERTMNAIEASIRKEAPYDIEYRVVHPDGTMRWISATGHTFRDEFDRPTRMGGVARDITEKNNSMKSCRKTKQGDKEKVKQFGGLGLGLAISKAIIDAHGGAITVRSDGKDRGSAFAVRLCLAGEPVEPGKTAEE